MDQGLQTWCLVDTDRPRQKFLDDQPLRRRAICIWEAISNGLLWDLWKDRNHQAFFCLAMPEPLNGAANALNPGNNERCWFLVSLPVDRAGPRLNNLTRFTPHGFLVVSNSQVVFAWSYEAVSEMRRSGRQLIYFSWSFRNGMNTEGEMAISQAGSIIDGFIFVAM